VLVLFFIGKTRISLNFIHLLKRQHNYTHKNESEKLSYTNDLHDALLKKDGRTFWNCWRSKFEPSAPCSQVEGCVDDDIIANKFSQHFSKSYNYNNKSRGDSLFDQYRPTRARSKYSGTLLSDSHAIDTELISKVISDIHCGKAPDIVGLTAEHLQYSHPSSVVILSKLFQLIMLCGRVSSGFK